jgi:predicted nucleic acid-binding protein
MSMVESRRPQLFFDASALCAGVISEAGSARALLLLSETGAITITVSEQVIVETERTLARKAPAAVPFYRETLRASRIRIVKDPSTAEVAAVRDMIAHEPDVPILVAAIKIETGYLVTLNRRHLIDDPEVARRSGLRIGARGDALAWVRNEIGATRQETLQSEL